LKDYAKVNGIEKCISFSEEVTSVERTAPGKWKVDTNKGRTIEADGVCVCNGHYEIPEVPEIENPEVFDGVTIHSHEYKEKTKFAGKNVAILGANMSALEIAAELCTVCP
jgi:dimethylaniline monooxygenase (N-oxide forming)